MNGAIRQMARSFPAERFEGKSVVGADMAFFLDKEEFVVGRIGRQKANAFEIESDAVNRFNAERTVRAAVVVVFEPLDELAVERVEGGKVELPG